MLRHKKKTWDEEQRLAEAGARVRIGFGKGKHSTLYGRVVGYVQQAISRDGEEFVIEPLLLVAVDGKDVMDIVHDVAESDKPAVAQLLKQTFSREGTMKSWSQPIWTVQTRQPDEFVFPHPLDDAALPGVNAEFPA
jgi:hypothetical protein